MSTYISANEVEDKFVKYIRPSFAMLQNSNWKMPPSVELSFWDNIKNSQYANKYIAECLDYLCKLVLTHPSAFNGQSPQANQSSVTSESSENIKSILLSLMHIAISYKKKNLVELSQSQERLGINSSDPQFKLNDNETFEDSEGSETNETLASENAKKYIHGLAGAFKNTQIETKGTVLINSVFRQVKKGIQFVLSNYGHNILPDLSHESIQRLFKLSTMPVLPEFKSIPFLYFNVLIHQLQFNYELRSLFYTNLIEYIKTNENRIMSSKSPEKVTKFASTMILNLHLFDIALSAFPGLGFEQLQQTLPVLNALISHPEPISSIAFRLHEYVSKELKYPGYSYYQLLYNVSNLSPITQSIPILYNNQTKLFPNMMYLREVDRATSPMTFIDFVNFYAKSNLHVDVPVLDNKGRPFNITNLFKLFGYIKFTPESEQKILSKFDLQSDKRDASHKPRRSSGLDSNAAEEDEEDIVEEGEDLANPQFVKSAKPPLPPFIPLNLVKVPQIVAFSADNSIPLKHIDGSNVTDFYPNFHLIETLDQADSEVEKDEKSKSKGKEKKDKKDKKKSKDAMPPPPSEPLQEVVCEKSPHEQLIYFTMMHKVFTDNIILPISEYYTKNENAINTVTSHRMVIAGNDDFMGTILHMQIISSMSTLPKSTRLNLELLKNLDITYYLFPVGPESGFTQISNFISSIDPIYEQYVQNIFDLTTHIGPVWDEASKVGFTPVEEDDDANEMSQTPDIPEEAAFLKGKNPFSNDHVWFANPAPTVLLQFAIQHYLLFARHYIQLRVWKCVIVTDHKEIIVPFLTSVSIPLNVNEQSKKSEELSIKKLIIENVYHEEGQYQKSAPQKVKLFSITLWNTNPTVKADPRDDHLVKEICYSFSHSSTMQLQDTTISPLAYSSQRLILDSSNMASLKQIATKINSTSDQPANNEEAQILSLQPNDEEDHQETKPQEVFEIPKKEAGRFEQSPKTYQLESINGIIVTADKDQQPFTILIDGKEIQNVKRFAIEPMESLLKRGEQMTIKIASFSDLNPLKA